MNIETVPNIPKRLIKDPQILGRICWNFANRLTDNKWILEEKRGTEFSRTERDVIGVDTIVGETEITSSVNDVRIGFFAAKRTVEGYKGHPMDIGDYRVTMSISQSVQQSEVPPYILDEIFESKEEVDDDEEESYDTILDSVERDNIDDFEIKREQSVTYRIGDQGEIEAYYLSYSYLIEDEVVHDIDYSSDYGTRITAPIALAETGEIVDRKPAVLLYLSDAQLETEIKEMDESWFQYIQHQTITELAAFGAQDQEQHRRQVLAMISLVSSGMCTLRQLATPA